jgi:two-component system copper resistance phosphate regulon response regulator CusR
MGADDCLTKPFLLQELIVRLRALLRRPPILIDKLQIGDLELDSIRRKVIRKGKSIQLTPKEFAILEYLMRNAGRPVTRTMLVEHVWNGRFEGLTNIVDVYINYLRSKIDRGFDTRLIRTVHGIGYMVVDRSKEAVANDRPIAYRSNIASPRRVLKGELAHVPTSRATAAWLTPRDREKRSHSLEWKRIAN